MESDDAEEDKEDELEEEELEEEEGKADTLDIEEITSQMKIEIVQQINKQRIILRYCLEEGLNSCCFFSFRDFSFFVNFAW